jgi:hypothetical protein
MTGQKRIKRGNFHLVDPITLPHPRGMARTWVTSDIFSEGILEIQSLSLRGYGLVAGVGLLDLALELLDPHAGIGFTAVSYAELAVETVAFLTALYLIAVMIAKVPVSWKGGLRFSLVTILSIGIPVGSLLWIFWSTGRNGDMPGAVVVIISLLLLVALFILPLLSAWPVAQALSDRLVSPLRIMKATRGHRWGLIAAGYLTTALNKLFPATSAAKGATEFIALAVGNSAVSCISLLISASIAGTAWKFAVLTDPALAALPARAE